MSTERVGGSCRDGVGPYRGEVGLGKVQKISRNNLICHKLGILSFLLTNYCQLLSG